MSGDIYYLIFLNSLKASVIASLYSESAWFAALQFGSVDTLYATIMAVCGSFVGTAVTFFVGYYFAQKRGDWFAFKESWYQRIVGYKKYSTFLLLLPFQSVPIIGFLWGFFILAMGFFGAKPVKALGLIFIGRIVYYGVYLMIFNFARA